MASFHLYDKLLTMPLFQGMSSSDLSQIVGNIKFSFQHFGKKKTVVTAGEVCHDLYFLLDGIISYERKADDYSYTITELLSAPIVLQPECMFGLSQRYTHTICTVSECNFIAIDKDDTIKLVNDYIIFRQSLINITCTMAQKSDRQPWRKHPISARHHIIRFIDSHCIKPAGEKIIKIKMNQLAAEINDNRLNVSNALNDMEAEGLINLHRGSIHIPSFERLLKE